VLSVVVALSASTLAQQPISPTAPSAERLRQYVTYLSSDALEGRRTGTAGANDAAHYIAGEFSQIGLRPAFKTIPSPRNRGEARSNYRQKFPYVAGVKLGTNNQLVVGPSATLPAFNLQAGKDWTPLGFSSNGRIEPSTMVFVAFGITDEEMKYNDYRAAVRGKIALAMSGTPDGDNPHGKFARYEEVRWKAIAARNAGATALLIISREDNFQDDRLSRLHYSNTAGEAGLPVAVVSRQAALRLMGKEKDTTILTTLESVVRRGIAEQLKQERKAFGLAAYPVVDTIPISDALVTLSTDLIRQEVPAFNIAGILDGSDPTLKNEAIVIGAHYDHLGRGGEGSRAQREGEVHHGADDNASGVAGVLELARTFTNARPRPKRTIIFIAFSGEEEGLLGSNYYVNHPVVPLASTVAMINMDMIGRLKDKKLVIGGVGTAQQWRAMIDSANLLQSMAVNAGGSAHAGSARPSGIPMVVGANGQTVVSSDSSKQFLLTLNEDGFGPSDHSSFYAKQIPVLFFWTGTHSDYHKPSDTADKINYEDEARILVLVSHIVRDIASSDKRPTYTLAKSDSTPGRSTGFRVYLGTIPNYADSNDGLLLDSVREDSPAAKAGLRAGDKIVKLAGRDVRNVYDYTYALGEMKAGEEYEVELIRGSERLKLKLTPAARK
ncbi:MAG: M20/M25/M40 family metallo-hydrolase, partial [Pyrinomonadaceae bacterium]